MNINKSSIDNKEVSTVVLSVITLWRYANMYFDCYV